MVKQMTQKALGKHMGHACEGHLRGLLARLAVKHQCTVVGELPFTFHVKPDAVMLDKHQKIRLLAIVAYWNNSRNSDSKFHRTRSEYTGATQARVRYPASFARKAQTITVLYGATNGWKAQVLKDMKAECAPLLFLPDLLGAAASERVVKYAFSLYLPHWQRGGKSAREEVESEVAAKSALTVEEKKIVAALRQAMSRTVRATSSHVAVSARSSVRTPTQPISTRYRQALGILSVFPNGEVIGWQSRISPLLTTTPCVDFALRGHFLGVGDIALARRIGRVDPVFRPKEAKRQIGSQWVYAPDLIDFTMWESLPSAKIVAILDDHRSYTGNPTSVFEGGAFDQCCGNWRGICSRLSVELPTVIAHIRSGCVQGLTTLLESEGPITSEAWHPAASSAHCFPLWGVLACALAQVVKDRAVRSAYDSRRQTAPDGPTASRLAKALIGTSSTVGLLDQVRAFADALIAGNLDTIANLTRPELFSLEHPCSWVSDFYNTLTTNSSHNPLNTPVLNWLRSKYPSFSWHGWPAKRSVALKELLGITTGRRQWQFLGMDAAHGKVVAAEVKSITANHWGDKSKEIYDRVAESRSAAKAGGVSIHCIGVLDGDVGKDQFMELQTGIGYDEVYSIEELL